MERGIQIFRLNHKLDKHLDLERDLRLLGDLDRFLERDLDRLLLGDLDLLDLNQGNLNFET